MKRSYIREILDATNEKTISFAGGLPDESLFPLEDIRKATNKVLKKSSSLQYSKSQGDENLREKIADFYNKYFDFPTSKDEILITTGSQQAFDIICKSMDFKEVLVQSPTYIGALSAFSALRIKTKTYEKNQALEEKLNENNTLYCMSDICNPSGKTLSKSKREKIKETLEKKDSFIIEDGAYSFLDFDGEIQKPISAIYEKSFHLGSFSKIIAPGLRVGWIRAKKEYVDKILIAKEAVDLHTPTLNQMILNEYLEKNDLEYHLDIIRYSYKQNMEFLSECFEKFLPSFKFEKPKGGMFIYGSFEEDSMSLAKSVLEDNIAFVPGSVFYSDGKKSNEARFNFTNASKEEMIKGIKIISKHVNNVNAEKITNSSIWFNMFSSYINKNTNL